MFRIPMAKLINTNSTRSTTLALSAEFPDFAIRINARNRQHTRLDIFPSSKRRLLFGLFSGSRSRAVSRCWLGTIANQMVALAAVTLPSVEGSRTGSCRSGCRHQRIVALRQRGRQRWSTLLTQQHTMRRLNSRNKRQWSILLVSFVFRERTRILKFIL
jgi:hypothetical protein